MALVIAAAFFMAVLFILFRVFGQRNVALLPAIVVNYFVAFTCGVFVAPPWHAADLSPIIIPVIVLGSLFISIFYLTGISSQQAGVAATTVASKMSLVLTVLFAVLLHGDRPGIAGWTGIVLAVLGVVLSSATNGPPGARNAWLLPLVLFLGNAAIDILINWVQRVHLTASTEAVFPTLVFGCAGIIGVFAVRRGPERKAFGLPSTWIGGAVLGIVNYAALFFVVRALARSGMPGSSVYPLINIIVILFGTALSMMLFAERPRKIQLVGIACSVIALLLILQAHA